MGISDFFNSIAGNFINRYRELARQTSFVPRTEIPVEPESTELRPASDSVEISPEAAKAASNDPTTKTTDSPPATNDDADEVADNDESKETPIASGEADADDEVGDYTKKLKQLSRLDYRMDLQFNLSTLTSVIERIENGDTSSIEEFAAANFGLSAEMSFRGFQQINAHGDFNNENQVTNGRTAVSSRNASQYSAANKNFRVDSFRNEAFNLRRGMHSSAKNNHFVAVNKFSLRYQYDAGMDFSFLNRFNVQTRSVSETAPDQLNNYLTSAGNVAESGTTEMMTAFFDAVDGYLAQAESDLMAKADEFFSMAAEELGFSGDMVELAKDQLTGSIDSFFDRVNSAVDKLQFQYAPESIKPTIVEPVVPPQIDPTTVTDEIKTPAMA